MVVLSLVGAVVVVGVVVVGVSSLVSVISLYACYCWHRLLYAD